eukprot:CAMPEP_0198644340 /NCGR_PEP_ID=MMETSP1467-20131203/550_1 /TAXON_ID=1462469 /ORGANISM="unid. sp., Strain CCMP2135" /LENGTH=355 /DNA_ID=CAMNT_0044379793 /DNA_START=1 /DNA_END=1068 /DNA_ORIENTATION=-
MSMLTTYFFPSTAASTRTLSDEEHVATVKGVRRLIGEVYTWTGKCTVVFNSFHVCIAKLRPPSSTPVPAVSTEWTFTRLIGSKIGGEVVVVRRHDIFFREDACISRSFEVCHGRLEAMKEAAGSDLGRCVAAIDAGDLKWVEESVVDAVMRGDPATLLAGVPERAGRSDPELARVLAARGVQVAHLHVAHILLALRDAVEPSTLVFAKLRGAPPEPKDATLCKENAQRPASLRLHDDDSRRERERKEEWLLRLKAKVDKRAPFVAAVLQNLGAFLSLATDVYELLAGLMDVPAFEARVPSGIGTLFLDPSLSFEDDRASHASATNLDNEISTLRRRRTGRESSTTPLLLPLPTEG